MCETCADEYGNPADRRFHSQTNSCPTCGIRLTLCDGEGNEVVVEPQKLFSEVAGRLSEGKIIALKNTGGYLLCCDAENPEAVDLLRKRKRRPAKPFALMYPSIESLEREIGLTEMQRKALQSPVRPIVLLPLGGYRGGLALQEIAPGLRHLGVMLPYSGLLELLAQEFARPIVATSGNLHGSPIISEEEEAMSLLNGVADFFVHHNLKIENPQDDSVMKFSERNELSILFRRSRGLAPNFFDFHDQGHKACVMAMGSQLKSTLAFVPNEYLYVSQYLGNLDHFDVYQRFLHSTDAFARIFEQAPKQILVDAHPGYLITTRGKEMASQQRSSLHEIQHHRAHFASVLGEHGLFEQDQPVLGVIWDGTGFGDDRQIWGGEFFLYRDKSMGRIRHFDYFDWIAGDKMALEPRLSLFSLSEGSDFESVSSKFTREEFKIYTRLLEGNQLKTSSVGRIFDAVASLLGICDLNSYEGEAAIRLENSIEDYEIGRCKALIGLEKDPLSAKLLLQRVSEELDRGADVQETAANFLFTLASLVRELADSLGVKKVAFSGGVFQNSILTDMIQDLLKKDFETYFNVNLAPNDENVSYGQMMYYLNGIQAEASHHRQQGNRSEQENQSRAKG
jgi:hydrogenase maturation protein HypF